MSHIFETKDAKPGFSKLECTVCGIYAVEWQEEGTDNWRWLIPNPQPCREEVKDESA